MVLYQGRMQQIGSLYWVTPSPWDVFSIHDQPQECPGPRTTTFQDSSCGPASLRDMIYGFAEPDTPFGSGFFVCQVIGSCFSLETPWSLSIQEWCHKERQFYNCPTDDGTVKGNQLCKLWDVSHTSICAVTVWKLELYSVNMQREPETTCNVFCPNYLRRAPLHPWCFFSLNLQHCVELD